MDAGVLSRMRCAAAAGLRLLFVSFTLERFGPASCLERRYAAIEASRRGLMVDGVRTRAIRGEPAESGGVQA